VYPIAQSLFPEISDRETEEESERITEEFLERMGFEEVITPEEIPEGSEEYDADLIRARAVARHQFGIDAADALLRGEVELVVSRKTGKIRNVVSDGEHVLSMRAADGLYTLREEGARRILSAVPAPRLRIVVSDDAVPFVSQGRNAFCQFVLGGDEGLRPMEEVIVTDGDDNFLATGRAVLTLPEIRSFRKGVAVKVRSGSGEEP